MLTSAREAWFDDQLDLDPERLVFIDETWTATNIARSHGRCRRGERLRMGFPHGHRKTTTLVAGLRTTGMVAPMVLDGPINGEWFEAYVRQVLAPELRPGDIVTMDNLSSQKRGSVRELIEHAGAKLMFLPPYSPDFNPIEKAFARLKALLRKAAERTVPGLWDLIGTLVDLFHPTKCANYFSSCGYEPDWSESALGDVENSCFICSKHPGVTSILNRQASCEGRLRRNKPALSSREMWRSAVVVGAGPTLVRAVTDISRCSSRAMNAASRISQAGSRNNWPPTRASRLRRIP
jgi:transposase